MNTEDRLRHASEEIERVTASLTAPPIGGVRRSARLRTVGVAVGAALGAIVLVGGVVLAFGSGGETTLAPAGPSDTTAPILVDGIRVVIPELDPPPQFDLGDDSHEVEFQGPGELFADDVRSASARWSVEWLDHIDHVVFAGASGESRAYVIAGEFGSKAPSYLVGQQGECMSVFVLDARHGGCGDAGARDSIMPGVSILDDRATFTVAGRAPQGSSVVVVEVDDTRFWRRTRDRYAFLAVEGPVDSRVRYIVYDVHGNVLQGTTIHTGEDPRDEAPAVTIAPAVEADSTCSGGLHYPTTYPRADLPEPVVQTVAQISLFGSRCWFDELATVAGGSFTGSLDGGDPAQRWASQEEYGDEPMHALMRILDMPHGTVDLDDGLMYVWPAASGHDGEWDTIPEADKEALRTLYDDDDLAVFEDFGSYIGYRLGITASGDWSFFVAGD